MPPIFNVVGGGGGGGGSSTAPVTQTFTMGAGVAVRDFVFPSTAVAGQVDRARSNVKANGRPIGCVSAVNSPAAGQCQVVLKGPVTGFAGLTLGATYLLGTAVGTIVAESDVGNPNYPTAAGNVVKAVGVASAADTIEVQVEDQPLEL